MQKPEKYEEITPERLKNYKDLYKEYETLLRHKKNLIEKIGGLHAVDYSRERVQSGNAPKTSEQERYAMALQNINNKIRKYEAWIRPEKEIIKNQLARIRTYENSYYYRWIIILRYLRKWEFKKITYVFFQHEKDFEAQRFYKYHDKTMRWHREALHALAQISAQPYVPVVKQLHLQEFHY